MSFETLPATVLDTSAQLLEVDGPAGSSALLQVAVGDVTSPSTRDLALVDSSVTVRAKLGAVGPGKEADQTDITWIEAGRILSARSAQLSADEMVEALDRLEWSSENQLDGFVPSGEGISLVTGDGRRDPDGDSRHTVVMTNGEQRIWGR